MTLDNDVTLEDEYLTHQDIPLVPVVNDEGRNTNIEAHYFEMKVRDSSQSFLPILPEGVFALNHAVTVREQLRGNG